MTERLLVVEHMPVVARNMHIRMECRVAVRTPVAACKIRSHTGCRAVVLVGKEYMAGTGHIHIGRLVVGSLCTRQR